MWKINYHPGMVILLTISVLFFCIQASVTQLGNVSNVGSIKPITQSVSQPQTGKLLYSDDLAFRKISNFPVSSDANITKYFKNGRYHMSVISGRLFRVELCREKFHRFCPERKRNSRNRT